ncbi:hypothetical protein [Noviherbaspirillum pedocola]|uniref:hypothetical protein n=1 Tax=Noviherbaspirillum pedocola TaxID=2801341 RepID=UPI002D7E2A29|nr:hypothetical protein [Noviherbaspirillum pedocola]
MEPLREIGRIIAAQAQLNIGGMFGTNKVNRAAIELMADSDRHGLGKNKEFACRKDTRSDKPLL